MVSRGFPKEKIDAICAKGGLPDEDCPNIPSLYRYWVQTSCVLKDTEEVKQQATATLRANIDQAGIRALLDSPTGAGVRQACLLVVWIKLWPQHPQHNNRKDGLKVSYIYIYIFVYI